MDVADLALELIKVLSSSVYQDMLLSRYKLEQIGESPLETMELIAKKRGFILSETEWITREQVGLYWMNFVLAS